MEITGAPRKSLEIEPEEDIETAWRQEVAARVAALDAGEAETIPWESILNRFRARLDERRLIRNPGA